MLPWMSAITPCRLSADIAEALQGVMDNIVKRPLGHFDDVHPDHAKGVRATLNNRE
jgi:catalase